MPIPGDNGNPRLERQKQNVLAIRLVVHLIIGHVHLQVVLIQAPTAVFLEKHILMKTHS